MAELHRKQTIIKKRKSEFHKHKEPLLSKKGIFGALMSGARTVHKIATSEKTKRILHEIGEGSKRFAEAHGEKKHKRKAKKRARR